MLPPLWLSCLRSASEHEPQGGQRLATKPGATRRPLRVAIVDSSPRRQGGHTARQIQNTAARRTKNAAYERADSSGRCYARPQYAATRTTHSRPAPRRTASPHPIIASCFAALAGTAALRAWQCVSLCSWGAGLNTRPLARSTRARPVLRRENHAAKVKSIL